MTYFKVGACAFPPCSKRVLFLPVSWLLREEAEGYSLRWHRHMFCLLPIALEHEANSGI